MLITTHRPAQAALARPAQNNVNILTPPLTTESVTLSEQDKPSIDWLPYAMGGAAVLGGGATYLLASNIGGATAAVVNTVGGGLAGLATGAAVLGGAGFLAGKHGKGGWAAFRGAVNGAMIGGAVGGVGGLLAGTTLASSFGPIIPAVGGAVLGAGLAFAVKTASEQN